MGECGFGGCVPRIKRCFAPAPLTPGTEDRAYLKKGRGGGDGGLQLCRWIRRLSAGHLLASRDGLKQAAGPPSKAARQQLAVTDEPRLPNNKLTRQQVQRSIPVNWLVAQPTGELV